MTEKPDISVPAPTEKWREMTHALLPLAHLEGVARTIERLGAVFEENEGLANEVLRGYEQLNLLFELTHTIAQITDVPEIEQILIARLVALLGAETVEILTPDSRRRACRTTSDGCSSRARFDHMLAALQPQITRVRETRDVAVAAFDGRRVIIGALGRLDGVIDVVVVQRPPGARDFTAGDVLMLDSVLSFVGQIITNSEMHAKLNRMSFEVTRALVAAIDQKDHYTSGHSERVGRLARLTGTEMGLPAVELQMLEWAGLLHDVGKIGIPEEILNKPGRLTDDEYDIIKKHPRKGYEILKPIASFEGVLAAVLHHHENSDGSGYPDGLLESETALFARIIHVVDVFDALTSSRSYRAAFPMQKACEILRSEAGTKMDPLIVDAFMHALERMMRDQPDYFAAMARPRREIGDEAAKA